MKLKHVAAAMAAGSALMLSGCIDLGGKSSSGISLKGDWMGVLEHYEASGPLGAGYYYGPMSASVDGKNNITNFAVTSFVSGLTGSITKVQKKIYDYTLSDGSMGGFMVDGKGKHAGILDISTGNFGVLEKGATTIPTFVQADIGGTWSGYSVDLDAFGNVTGTYSSSATVTCPVSGDCGFIGSDKYGPFSGTFPLNNFYPNGVFVGTFSSATVTSGNVYAFVSPDKTFAATYACASGFWPPSSSSYCSYSIWNKK